jgi:ankyrin repeat protein
VASLSQNINNLLLEVQSDYGSCDAMLDDDIPHAILFSIANGFAGFSDIPVVALFRALRNEHHVNMKVFGFLRDAPQVIAEPVAVNLFRAAIEASDMDAVRILLKTAATRGIRINPNDLKCEIEGFSVTPMECASRLQNIELVRTLLHEGADVNKTYGDGPLHRGAAAGLEDSEKRPAGGLEWASGWGNDIPPPSFELVCLLVQAKARVRPVVIQVLALSKWPVDSRIITTLIDSITSEEHMSLLRILPSLIRLLDDSNGLHITEKLFSLCEDAQCYQCTIKTERLPQRTTNYYHAFEETSLERSLVQAVNRRNFTICKLLLRCTSAKGRGLSAAIGRGDLRIAKLLLEHGANINEGAHETSFESPDNVRERKGRLTPLMTPLGEAIRSRDDDLLALVEERGAWACMADELHVQAAAEAAAEIGDANLLGRILEFGDTHKQQPFGAGIVTAALKVAIDNNNTQCALMLLANSDEPVEAAALELALKKRNKRVVAKILENTLSFDSYHLVEEAVRWGDVDVINDLLDAGVLYRSIKMRAIDSTDGSEYGLRAAVELGSFELVDLLLSAGVNVNDSKNDMHGSEPLRERTLAAAVRCNNEDMVRYLIHKGAEPAIEQAFVFAIERGDDSCFAILMNAFRARHHSGLAGFGADILIEAMKKDNLMYFQVLIDSGVDVNSYSHKCACRPLANAIQNHSVAVVEKLLLAGAETNSIVQYYDRSGSVETPLLMAIESGNTEKLALLLQHKADVNRPARQGIRRTPLQRACELGNLAIVKLLLHRNADFNAPPAKHGGGTALQLAALSGSVSIVKYLLSLGADVHAPTSSSHGRSALENAATNGRFSMIKVLWDATHYKGFPPDEVERAMGYARDHGYPHCAEYISNLAKASLVFIQSVISTPTER